jgi:hypothetical protein
MFNNSFTNQHQYDYSKSSDNEDDETLNLHMIVNVDDEKKPHVFQFRDASGYAFVVSYDQ